MIKYLYRSYIKKFNILFFIACAFSYKIECYIKLESTRFPTQFYLSASSIKVTTHLSTGPGQDPVSHPQF